MIVVDSSVWVDFFRGAANEKVAKLRALLGSQEILVGDIILCEVLKGFSDDRDASAALRALSAFRLAPMVGSDVAIDAAANYRVLRRRGITIRGTIDLLIGSFCIAHEHHLLHADRDFEPMARYLGLRTV
jgi:predicted nucleic acid-binding protein